MAFELIRLEIDGAIATITLNRPDALNAFSRSMGAEIRAALDVTDADDAVRAVIVTGAGRAFCAGADLAEGGRRFAPTEEMGELPRDGGGELTLRIYSSHKPVIGAINGPAVGVGTTMTLPMDYRLASSTARFSMPFTRRGIVPESCSSWFLPRIVGVGQALDWLCSGRMFSAAEAHAAGLVGSVHEPDELMDAARAVAEEIAEHTAPVSVALARQLVWRMLGAGHPMDAHRAESRAMAIRGAGKDAYEGITSFLEKRPAVFSDSVSADLPDVFPGWREPEFS